MSQWFESWFDSHYYHKLYFDRDEVEATNLITALMNYLKPPPNSYMIDIACGKGRHSKTLASFGHHVTGIDIAPRSIAFAKKFEYANLEFFQHDMRLNFRVNYYNLAFNLFTSFGYFNTKRENNAAIRTIAQCLKPDGLFVMDYLNSHVVAKQLVAVETKQIENTSFFINRFIENNFFIKQIQIVDPALSKPLIFQEKVSAFTLADFEAMFAAQGLQIVQCFGNYKLEPFDKECSPRLIIIAKKLSN